MSDDVGSARGGTRDRRRRRPRRARAGSPSPCAARCRRTWCRARPTMSRTGIVSSASRSQFDGCTPWPSTRSWYVSQSTVLAFAALLDAAALARQRREQRLREPAFEERVDPVAFDLLRELLVGDDPAARASGVGDAGRRAHEREALHRVGSIERELQAEPPTLRVPDVRRRRGPAPPRARRGPRARPRRSSTLAARRAAGAHLPPRTGRHAVWRLGEAADQTHDRTRRSPRGHPRMSRDATTAFARTLVDEWARPGRHRRVPRAGLALGAARARAGRRRPRPASTCISTSARRRSSRSASRKATGRPAIVLCTSGTAAANFHPAVLEAHHGRVPMIVATADRPPELRDTGAGQTIDQVEALRRRGAVVLRPRPAGRPRRRRRDVAGARVASRCTTRSGRRPARAPQPAVPRAVACPTGAPLSTRPVARTAVRGPRRAPGVARTVGADARARSPTLVGAHRRGRRASRAGAPASQPSTVLAFADGRGLAGARRPHLEPAGPGHAISTYDPLLRDRRVRRRAPPRSRAPARRDRPPTSRRCSGSTPDVAAGRSWTPTTPGSIPRTP